MLKPFSKLLSAFLTIICLVSCSITNPKLGNSDNEVIDKALQEGIAINKKTKTQNRHEEVPASIQRALMQTLDIPAANISSERATTTATNDRERFNINVNNVPAKEFFAGLIKNTSYNITVSPQVSGMISLNLKNVTIPEVMDTVRDVYGFEYVLSSHDYQVLPRRLETRVFTVNYLDMNRSGKSSTSFGSGELTNTPSSSSNNQTPSSGSTANTSPGTRGIATSSIETSSKANFWEDLKNNLIAVVGNQDGRNVVINSQSGMVIVRAYPDELRSVANYLDSIQSSMNRQVIIEAQILEVQLSAQFQTGIDWRFLGLSQGARWNAPPADANSDISGIDNIPTDFSSIFSLKISSGGTFSSFIKLLSSQGKVNVLSSPRIATTNNQKAVIKVGSDKFFVTNVTSNTTTSSAVSDTQNIELTPFFSGIALDVTPQINDRGEITLHIHPVVSSVTRDRQQFVVNGKQQDLPLAQSSIRESDSIVRAQNGQVIAIGGLIENNSSQYGASTPGTERLGLFSALFKSVNKKANRFELVILLRPVVVDSHYDWNKNLQEAAERFKSTKGDDFRYLVEKSK